MAHQYFNVSLSDCHYWCYPSLWVQQYWYLAAAHWAVPSVCQRQSAVPDPLSCPVYWTSQTLVGLSVQLSVQP